MLEARYLPWAIAGGVLATVAPGTALWLAPAAGALLHMAYDAEPERFQEGARFLLTGARALPDRARQSKALFERGVAALPVKAATGAHLRTRPAGAPRDPLLVTLDEQPHRLIIGHTRGGKTTLMHAMATGWAEQGARVLVCDPDASPGQWPGCRVVGGGDNFAAMGEGLRLVEREVGKRRTLRAEGQRTFAPVHIVVDEAQDVVAELPEAWPIMESVARRGAKLNMHLTVGVQDKQVKTLGLQGKSELLRNFVVADIYKDREGRRMASMKDPAGVKVAMPIPKLTDPETLIKAKTETQPVVKTTVKVETYGDDDPLLAALVNGAPATGLMASGSDQTSSRYGLNQTTQTTQTTQTSLDVQTSKANITITNQVITPTRRATRPAKGTRPSIVGMRKRREMYQEVKRLTREGWSGNKIRAHLGADRNTIQALARKARAELGMEADK